MKNNILAIYLECKKFYAACDQLDRNQETPFIMGDKYHRSIYAHKRMMIDIFNYCYSAVLNLKCYLHQLDPISLESVEDYRKLLKEDSSNEEFAELVKSTFVYCKCLHPRPTCPIKKLKCSQKQIETFKYVSRT